MLPKAGIRGAGRWLLWAGVAAVVLVAALIPVIESHWPYRYRNVKPLLQNVFAAQIEVHDYHRTYFPRPGFVAHGFVLRRKSTDPSLPALGSAQTVIVQGGWLDLLLMRGHVNAIEVDGLHIVLPASGTKERQEDFPAGSSGDFSGPVKSIGKLSVRNAVLEIQQTGSKPLTFQVDRLDIRDMAKGNPLHYVLQMTSPMPRGRVSARGDFGPVDTNDLGNTPLRGEFTFDNVRLNDIGTLRGTLAARGHFEKTLAAITADVTAEAPDFALGDGRSERVTSHAQCTINGLNGDVVLNDVALRLGRSTIDIHGTLSGKPKVTRLDISTTHARAQDLMQPYLHGRVPIAGSVSGHAHAELLPGKGQPFLARMRMDGSFDVPAERLASKNLEAQLSAFSERAQGGRETAAQAANVDVLSSVEGPFSVRDGIVTTQRLHVAVAGASADLHGTYNLKNREAHLTGNLSMDSDISHATTGAKSDLLKLFAPFFKRKDKGAVVPIAITGGAGGYHVQGNLLHTK